VLTSDDEAFLRAVRDYVSENPHVAGFVGKAVSEGVINKLEKLKEHTSNMEAIAATLLHRRYKGHDAFILSKLEEAVESKQTFQCWDYIIDKLKKLKSVKDANPHIGATCGSNVRVGSDVDITINKE